LPDFLDWRTLSYRAAKVVRVITMMQRREEFSGDCEPNSDKAKGEK
jgi:hypothetical protein